MNYLNSQRNTQSAVFLLYPSRPSTARNFVSLKRATSVQLKKEESRQEKATRRRKKMKRRMTIAKEARTRNEEKVGITKNIHTPKKSNDK